MTCIVISLGDFYAMLNVMYANHCDTRDAPIAIFSAESDFNNFFFKCDLGIPIFAMKYNFFTFSMQNLIIKYYNSPNLDKIRDDLSIAQLLYLTKQVLFPTLFINDHFPP